MRARFIVKIRKHFSLRFTKDYIEQPSTDYILIMVKILIKYTPILDSSSFFYIKGAHVYHFLLCIQLVSFQTAHMKEYFLFQYGYVPKPYNYL